MSPETKPQTINLSRRPLMAQRPDWSYLSAIAALVILTCGAFWTRGAYLDDYQLIAKSLTGSYWDTALSWLKTFNARLTPALVMPGALRILSSTDPTQFPWYVIQALGVASFLATLFALNRIMALARINQRLRISVLLILALHPIKAQAVFWPSTIFIYVLPSTVFLLGVWLYFARACAGRESISSSSIAFGLMAFGALAIEQLLPLVLVVIFFRFMLYPQNRLQLSVSLAAFGLIIGTYTVFALTGTTAGRLQQFAGYNVLSFSHFWDVFVRIARAYIFYPLWLFSDRLAWQDFATLTIGAAIALVWVTSYVIVRKLGELGTELDSWKAKALGCLCAGGLVLCLAPISPFFVTRYYMPERVFYIPLFGAAIIAGVAMEFLWSAFASARPRSVLVVLSSLILAIFAGASLFAQSEFASYWTFEKSLLSTVNQQLKGAPPGTHLSVLGVPRAFGPTPSLIADFGLQGISEWMFPGQGFTISALDDFSEVLCSTCRARESGQLLSAQPATRAVIWTGHGFVAANKLLVMSAADDTQPIRPAGGPILAREYGISHDDTARMSLTIERVLYMTDLKLLAISVNTPTRTDAARARLIVHALDRAGVVRPFDEEVDTTWGFLERDGAYHRTIIIPRADKFIRLELWIADTAVGARNDPLRELPLSPAMPLQLLYR